MTNMGHNGGPELTPFEQSQEDITELYEEAKQWLDGAPVETQTQANGVQELKRCIEAKVKEAEDRRKEEVAPYNAGKDAVQAKYNRLTSKIKGKEGLGIKAIQACADALTPYLVAQAKVKEEEAEKKRKEAEEKDRIAKEAMRKSREEANLAEREKAEALIKEAEIAKAEAKKAEKDKPKATGRGRAATVRTSHEPEITDLKMAASWFWTRRKEEFVEFILSLARKEIGRGNRNIDGIKINEIKKVI